MNEDVFRAILAMDSYNRGYGAGVTGLLDTQGTQIGTAAISGRSSSAENSPEVNADFYAVAYNWNGETVISYRGTDNIWSDILSYPLAAGNYNLEQARLAAQFYLSVANQVRSQ